MKYFLFTVLLLPIITVAQMHIDFGTGAAILNKGLQLTEEDGTTIQSKTTFYSLNIAVGYTYNSLTLDGALIPLFGRATNTPNYLGFRAGYLFKNFNPAIGYYYNYCNTDNPGKNGWVGFGYSLQYNFILGDLGGWYIRAAYIDKSIQASIGGHIIIEF